MRLTRVALVAALLLGACSAPAIELERQEARRRFVAIDKNGGVLYTITEVSRRHPSEDQRFLLVRDSKGRDYLFSEIRSYMDQVTRFEIKDLKREVAITVAVAFPYKSRTRDEYIEEAKKHPELAQDLEVSVEAGGIVRTARESVWRDEEQGRELRSELREGLDTVFLEALERMRGVFLSQGEFIEFCTSLVGFVLHREPCAMASTSRVRLSRPDCLYDASFGFACSEKQKTKIAQAVAEKRPLHSY